MLTYAPHVPFVFRLEMWTGMLLALVFVVLGVMSLVHAVRSRADAFTAIGTMTKPAWVALLAVSTSFLFLSAIQPSAGVMFAFIGVIAIGVYRADVRRRINDAVSGPGW